MSKITIEFQDTNGVTKTYQKEFGEDVVFVGDYFEACLEAYASFGYVNDIDVDVYGPEGVVVQTISWDKDSYINNSDDFPVDDVMSFLEIGKAVEESLYGKPKRYDYIDDIFFTIDSKDLSNMLRTLEHDVNSLGETEQWYMGHKY